MDIFSIVSPASCSTSLAARSKEGCLEQLASLMAKSAPDIPAERIYTALLEREQTVSTGLEHGIAIPHARLEELDHFIVGIAVAPKGVDFASLDGKRTNLFFTLIGPDREIEEHLRLIAQIVRVANNRRAYRQMINAPDGEALKEAFLSNVRGIDSAVSEDRERRASSRKLLAIVLFEHQYFEDLIALLIDYGINGAAVTDVQGMGSILSGIPLFSDFIDFLKQRKEEGRLIIALAEADMIPPLVEEIEVMVGDLDTHTGAMVVALDTFFIKGTLEIM